MTQCQDQQMLSPYQVVGAIRKTGQTSPATLDDDVKVITVTHESHPKLFWLSSVHLLSISSDFFIFIPFLLMSAAH